MNKKDIENFIEHKVEEREVKRSKLYLSNEDIEKEEWELIGITIIPQDRRCGIVDIKLAYKDDIRDVYTVRNSGNLHLNGVYPNFVKRQIISRIKEVAFGEIKKVAKKSDTIRTINRPTPITINRKK